MDTGTLEVYMEGTTRIQALGTLLSYLPPSALGRIEQLPSLMVAFLCHCPQSILDERLPFWSRSVTSTHAVSGVWLGLPTRPSAQVMSTNAVAQVSGQTILLGLYIFLRERLFEFGVPPKFTDGLLFTCMDGLLRHNKTDLELRRPDVKTRDYAELLQLQQKAHAKTVELIVYLRAVLSHTQGASLELAKAMRIAAAREGFMRWAMSKAFVDPTGRAWAYKFCQPLNLDQVRQRLILHDCLTQSKALEELVGRDERVYFRIDETSAISVLSAMQGAALDREPFVVELADREQPFTIIGMFKEDFWGHVRWGMYWTIKQLVQSQTKMVNIPEWSPLPFALAVTQLWFSSRPDHWGMAVMIMRDWVGLFARGPHLFVDEVEFLHRQVMPALLDRCTTVQVWHLMPLLLAFDFEHDELYKMESKDAPVFVSSDHADKDRLQLWYQTMHYLMSTKTADPGRFFRTNSKMQPCTTVSSEKCKDGTGPYAPYNVQTQLRRVHPCRFNICECKQGEYNTHMTWHVFALLEQQSLSTDQTVMFPLPDIGGGAEQHHCLHMSSWPVAHALSERDERLVYIDTYFPVNQIDRKRQSAALDIPDQFFFISATFRDSIGASDKIDLPVQTLQPYQQLLLLEQAPTEEKREQQQQQGKKRKSPEAPQFSPDPSDDEEEDGGKGTKGFRGTQRLKMTHTSSVKETMHVSWAYGSMADL